MKLATRPINRIDKREAMRKMRGEASHQSENISGAAAMLD